MMSESTTGQQDLAATLDKFDTGIADTTRAASGLLKAAASTTADGLAAAKSTLAEARLSVMKNARTAAATANESLREHPWRAVGVAAAAGVIVGFMYVSRRFSRRDPDLN